MISLYEAGSDVLIPSLPITRVYSPCASLSFRAIVSESLSNATNGLVVYSFT